jgi:hypothetical protein
MQNSIFSCIHSIQCSLSVFFCSFQSYSYARTVVIPFPYLHTG